MIYTHIIRRMLDPASPIPLYQQLVTALQARIASGDVQPGDYLPGELDLTEEFSVSRITAKRALDELAAAGLVTRSRGRGTQVVARASSVPAAVDGSIEGWLENVGHMQRSTSVRVLEVADIAASTAIAVALELEVGAAVQKALRVRVLDGVPMSYLETYLPADIAAGIGAADLGETPLLTLLERAGHNVAAARQSITASTATPEVARALDVPTGTALLDVRRTVRNAKQRPIQHIRALYRPDLYHIEMSLSRVGGAGNAHWTTNTSNGADTP